MPSEEVDQVTPSVGEERPAPEVEVREEEDAGGTARAAQMPVPGDLGPFDRCDSGQTARVLGELETDPHDLIRQEGKPGPGRILGDQHLESSGLILQRQDEVMSLGRLAYLPHHPEDRRGPLRGPELTDWTQVLELGPAPQHPA